MSYQPGIPSQAHGWMERGEEFDTTEAADCRDRQLSLIRSFPEMDCAWQLALGHPEWFHGESYLRRLQLLHIHPVIPTSLSTTDPSP